MRFTSSFGSLLLAKAVGNVLGDGHVREQGVVLEDGVDVALVGRYPLHRLARDHDVAFGGIFEPRQHAERGGLAAPRRPQQRQELSRLDLEIDAVDGRDGAEPFHQLTQLDRTLFIAQRRGTPLVRVPAVQALTMGRTQHTGRAECSRPRTIAQESPRCNPRRRSLDVARGYPGAVRPKDGAPSPSDRPGCSLCGRPTYDPGKRDAPWVRAVAGGRQVLICPSCVQDRPGWADGLDRCASCGETRLSVTLGEVTCRACGHTEPAHVAGA